MSVTELPVGTARADIDFEAFARRELPRLRRLAAARVRDVEDAAEIAAETLLRAYQHLDRFTDAEGAAAWCTVVAQRLAIDRLRAGGRAVVVAELPDGRRSSDAADHALARWDVRTALAALEAMPTRQAAVVWAREVEGLSYDQIAHRQGLSEPAVRSLLHRGRRALRDEFRRRGGTLPAVAPVLGLLRRLRPRHAALTSAAVAAAVGLTLAALPPSAPAPPRPAPGGAPSAAAPGRPAAHPAAAPAAPPPAVSAPAARAATADVRPRAGLPSLPSACTDRALAAGACVGSTDRPPGTRLVVPVAVPGSPLRRVGVSTDAFGGCPSLPGLLPLRCEPEETP